MRRFVNITKTNHHKNSSPRRSNRTILQQINKRCSLCGYCHNLGKFNQFLNKDINDRQQTARQLKICPNCPTEHPKRQCNSHYRGRIENCNGFYHSTTHRNNFNSSQTFSSAQQEQRNQQQQHQEQKKARFKSIPQTIITTIVDSTTTDTKHITANRSQFQPHGFNYGRVVGYNHNKNTRNAFSQNCCNQNYNLHNNNGSTFNRNYNNPNIFMLKTNSRQQNNGNSHNQLETQNQSQRQQNFSNNNPRPQNHTCSNNQISSWIRPQVQLQAIPVILYTEDVSIETCSFGQRERQHSNNKLNGKSTRNKNTDHIAVPISSLYGENILKSFSTEVLLGIGSPNSTRPPFNLPMHATSASDFQMPNVPVEMMNSVCADYEHLNNITFPQIRDNRIGVLIGVDAFILTVPLKFTTGPPGTPYGFST